MAQRYSRLADALFQIVGQKRRTEYWWRPRAVWGIIGVKSPNYSQEEPKMPSRTGKSSIFVVQCHNSEKTGGILLDGRNGRTRRVHHDDHNPIANRTLPT